jgi:hypothetical protein
MEVNQRLIFAVGEGAAEAAQVVGALRQAAVVPLVTPEALCLRLTKGILGTAFVVVDFARLATRQFLAILQAAAVGSPELTLGFLYGRGPDQLVSAAVRLRSEPAVAPPAGVQRVFNSLTNQLKLGGARLENATRQGAATDAVAALLRQPAELVFLIGHGNGFHLSVGGALLCRQPSATPRSDGFGGLPCFYGAPCARALIGSTKNESVIPIDHIPARRIVLLSCYGVMPTASAVDPLLLSGEGALGHSKAEAVVTTARASVIETADAAAFYYLANSGLPLGRVTGEVNSLRVRRGLSAEFACFGDPETRMTPTVVDVGMVTDGGTFSPVLPDERSDTPVDVRLRLPAGSDPAGRAVLDESPRGVGTVLLATGGLAYMTVGPRHRVPPRLSLVNAEEFSESAKSVESVARGSRFMSRCIQTAAMLLGTNRHPAIIGFAKEFEDLSKFLSTWPLTHLTAGVTLSKPRIAELYTQLDALLDSMAESLLDVYVELSRRLSSFNATALWEHFYDRTVFSESVATCRSCGNPADGNEWKEKLGRDSRRTAYCHACGPIADGNDVSDPGIHVTGGFQAGGALEAEIVTRNPYHLPLPLSACAVIQPFLPDRELPPHAVRLRDRLDATESRAVRFKVDIPSDHAGGIHHLGAVSVVGAEVTFHRIPVAIMPAGLTASPLQMTPDASRPRGPV